MKKSIINWMGVFGILSLLSYTAAVIFSPLAYPGYNWMSQAVSDLSAESAPSRILWNQLSALYGTGEIICMTTAVIIAKDTWNRMQSFGIYMFAFMNLISAVGYAMFPLTASGMPQGFQNVMHIVVTAIVVVLSILSLTLIIIGSFKENGCRSLGKWAMAALGLMILGAVSVNVVPGEYFGIPERFSVFAATGFNGVVGYYIWEKF